MLGIGQFMDNETPLPTKQLQLFSVFSSWLERDEISIPHCAGNKERIIGISRASSQMRACTLAAHHRIDELHSPIAFLQKAPQARLLQ
jgi:hypothetical protein